LTFDHRYLIIARTAPAPLLGAFEGVGMGGTTISGTVIAGGTRRERLRILDQCLGAVEDEAELGREVVSRQLAATIRPYAPSIFEGMAIAEAHDAILDVQESSLSEGDRHGSSAQLTVETARDLCQKIRRGMGELCILVWRAHEGRAWMALGYKTWDQFVREELGFSRSRSYQLVDQGSIMATLEEAAGVQSGVFLTESSARRIKPIVHELAKEIRVALTNDPGRDPCAAVDEVVKKGEARVDRGSSKAPDGGRSVVERLIIAVECLSDLPPAGSVLAQLSDDDLGRLRGLPGAANWINDFLTEWSARVGDGGSVTIGLLADAPFPASRRTPMAAYA
jgi:hypothetical protein